MKAAASLDATEPDEPRNRRQMEQRENTRVYTCEELGVEPCPPAYDLSLREERFGRIGVELFREWVDAGRPRRATA